MDLDREPDGRLPSLAALVDGGLVAAGADANGIGANAGPLATGTRITSSVSKVFASTICNELEC